MMQATWDDRLSRSDARLVAKAAREGWAVPGPVKVKLVASLTDAIDGADPRTLASIAAALVAMDKADTAADRLALDRERGSATNDITFRIVRDDQP
jgi:hypothetical protein